MTAGGAPEVEVRSRGAVTAAAGTLLGRPLAAWRERCAAELGLPAGLLVGAGHQPEWWHPGIAAKFLWAQALAARTGASMAWLLVDTDVRDPFELRYPAGTPALPRGAVHRFGPRAAPGTVPAARASCVPAPHDAARLPAALPCAAEGLLRAHDALLRHADCTDASLQLAHALVDTTPGLRAPAAIVRTSGLLRTGLGQALVERAARDPEACARAFNAAVAAAPRTARPLAEHGPRGAELPLWAPAPDGTRRRVHASELAPLRAAGTPLWPRAFLTGVLARAALCDRFVHGTGAALYERATDAFALAWLGEGLPPFDVATATLRLPFPADDGPPPVDAAARRRRWFDPLGGQVPSEGKLAALREIAALPRGSAERRARWRGMHAELASLRRAHACELAQTEALAAADRERARAAALRADRTWPTVLHPPEAVIRLAEALDRPGP